MREWGAAVIIIGSEGGRCGLVVEGNRGGLGVASVVMGWGWSSEVVRGEEVGCGVVVVMVICLLSD